MITVWEISAREFSAICTDIDRRVKDEEKEAARGD